MILLASGRDQELWLEPTFWVCAEYSFRILNQSDLTDLTGSLWIADFQCWSKPELSNPATGQKDRGLWEQECILIYSPFETKDSKHLLGTSGDDSSALIEFSPLWKTSV